MRILMDIRDLIMDLSAIERMLFVVGGGGAVGEMYGDGKTEPNFHDQWSMLECESWHFHLDMSLVKSIQFVEAEDHGAPKIYYVRFADKSGDTLMRCYFPNPFLDNNEKITDFQPDKLKVFEVMKDRYTVCKGIEFIKRS